MFQLANMKVLLAISLLGLVVAVSANSPPIGPAPPIIDGYGRDGKDCYKVTNKLHNLQWWQKLTKKLLTNSLTSLWSAYQMVNPVLFRTILCIYAWVVTPPDGVNPFLARDSMLSALYMLSQIHLSVCRCPSVCHAGGSVKNGWS